MKIKLIKMRRDGIVLNKGSLSYESEVPGYLTINDTQSNRLHRQAKTARLFADPDGARLLKELIDPVLMWANEERMMLSGFQHIVRSDVQLDVAQSWLCLIGWEQTLKTNRFPEDTGPISRKRKGRT